MNAASLLADLRAGITEDEWAALGSGGLKVSGFNRDVLLEMRHARAMDAGEIDEAQARELKAIIEDYLRRYLEEAPEAWRWIVIASLYLTFVARRPMHPTGLLQIREKREHGQTVYECPARSEAPDTCCRFCVCKRAAADPRG